jgi:hypothetical protein
MILSGIRFISFSCSKQGGQSSPFALQKKAAAGGLCPNAVKLRADTSKSPLLEAGLLSSRSHVTRRTGFQPVLHLSSHPERVKTRSARDAERPGCIPTRSVGTRFPGELNSPASLKGAGGCLCRTASPLGRKLPAPDTPRPPSRGDFGLSLMTLGQSPPKISCFSWLKKQHIQFKEKIVL